MWRHGSRACASPAASGCRRSVYNQVKGKIDLAFTPAGLHQVKNLAEMVKTLRVALDKIWPAASLRRVRARRWLALPRCS